MGGQREICSIRQLEFLGLKCGVVWLDGGGAEFVYRKQMVKPGRGLNTRDCCNQWQAT